MNPEHNGMSEYQSILYLNCDQEPSNEGNLMKQDLPLMMPLECNQSLEAISLKDIHDQSYESLYIDHNVANDEDESLESNSASMFSEGITTANMADASTSASSVSSDEYQQKSAKPKSKKSHRKKIVFGKGKGKWRRTRSPDTSDTRGLSVEASKNVFFDQSIDCFINNLLPIPQMLEPIKKSLLYEETQKVHDLIEGLSGRKWSRQKTIRRYLNHMLLDNMEETVQQLGEKVFGLKAYMEQLKAQLANRSVHAE